MKITLTSILFFIIQLTSAQEDFEKYRPIEPLYNNGSIDKFYEYLTQNIDFQKIQNENDVIIGFVLGKDGSMNHIKVSFCNTDEAEKEILSVLKNANKWDLSNQKSKDLFICYKIKLIFSSNEVKGMKKVMWFNEDVEDIKIDKNELSNITIHNKDIYNSAVLEVKPEYPDGIDEFYKFIAKNYRTPKSKKFVGGRVFVSFVIEKDGSLTDIKVLKDAGFGTGEEAIRVLKISKKWLPAEQDGKKVRCSYTLPISLRSN